MIQAKFVGDKVVSLSTDAYTFHEKSCYGEKVQNKIEYSPIEALFLVSEGRMRLLQGTKELSEDSLIRKLKKKDKKIEIKLAVFGDLRRKGYILKTALKFGADFRVYEKGIKPGMEHAKWLLYVVKENESISWHDFAAKNRIAHSTKKNLLLGLVDEESSVSYYEIAWTRL